MQGTIDLADRIERELSEWADEVHPGEPKRRTSEDAFAPVPMLAEMGGGVAKQSSATRIRARCSTKKLVTHGLISSVKFFWVQYV